MGKIWINKWPDAYIAESEVYNKSKKYRYRSEQMCQGPGESYLHNIWSDLFEIAYTK